MMKTILMNVAAEATYLPEQSSTDHQRFLWAYEITLSNESDETVQLLNRYWRITEMTGRLEEVRGPGVIGLQPVIKPRKSFTYTSFCQLSTSQGAMEGHYEMQTLEEEARFLVQIPKFILALPAAVSAGIRARLH